MTVIRYTKGWMVRDALGKIIAGPYYSLAYAEERDKELASKKRRDERRNKRQGKNHY